MTDTTTNTTESKIITVDIVAPNQNFNENLRRLNERYEDECEEIIDDAQRAMVEVLQEYSDNTPGIDYQEDSASIVFNMGNGESIYMTPVWTPFLYKTLRLTRQQLLELTTSRQPEINHE